MADDDGDKPIDIKFDGDVSPAELGDLKDSTKPEEQSKMNGAAATEAQLRKADAERLQTLNGPDDPGKTRAGVEAWGLHTIARAQTETPPTNPDARQPTQDNPPPTHSGPSGNTQHEPAAVSDVKHVSREELGSLKVPTKAQLQAQLNASTYSPEKQQKIAAQHQVIHARAMAFVRANTAERGLNSQSAAQVQQRTAVGLHAQSSGQGDDSARASQQRAKALNVFDRLSQQGKQPPNAKKATQEQSKTKAQSQSLTNLEQSRQKAIAATQNVFDKHGQQRDNSKGQQQEKEKSRGR
ncbi:MAG: hypothetical protein AAF702_05015 [Chloroflexota bacterium]